MLIVQNDRNIMKHIEQYKGITINQCYKIFYKHAKYGHDMARWRLKKLAENKYLHYYTIGKERVYCLERNSRITRHRLKALDLYAELVFNNCKILEFIEPKYEVKGKRMEPDGLIKFSFDGKVIFAFIEVDDTHYYDLSRYDDLYEQGDIQRQYGNDKFPMVICVTDMPDRYYSDNFDIVYLDYKLNNFVEKVLSF